MKTAANKKSKKNETTKSNDNDAVVNDVNSEATISTSQSIWNSIKDRDLGLFGLSGQFVYNYCKPLPLDDNKCHLKYKVSSVVPALESIASEYNFEVVDSYITLTRKQ